jgi:putative oxidoreductase
MKPTQWTDRGLLLIRFALGLVFVMHGWQKLTVLGVGGVAGFLGQIGVPFPSVSAVLITAAELGGGLALVAGLGTRAAGAILAFSMAVAIATVHISQGFFAPAGIEFPLTLLLVNLALVATGAGEYSLDAIVRHRRVVTRPRSDLKFAA